MLKTLRRIVQEVSAADNPKHALQIMVERIRASMATQACSVYMLDKQRECLVLMATKGLNQQAVGKVEVNLNQGLVGLISRREEPLNLDNASSHPDFLYHPEVGEERYRAFLGVPIIHQRRLLGVMAVQQEERRRYDESEEAFLITMAAQLAGVLVNVDIADLLQRSVAQERMLVGVAGASGIAIGKACVVYPLADLEAIPDRTATIIADEIDAFRQALVATREDLIQLSERLEHILPAEEHALFEAYLHILDSSSLEAEVTKQINKGHWAQGALRKVIQHYIQQLEVVDDEYLRERASDFQDIGRRILAHLQAEHPEKRVFPEETILVGEEISASMLAEVPIERLVGIISAKGSRSSHVAILARAMGVPTVMGVAELPLSYLEGKELIVDGYSGHVYISPSADLRQKFLALAKEEEALDEDLLQIKALPAESTDGYQIQLYINTGLNADASLALSSGAEGVGLYRTEVPFMMRDRFPAEEEQRIIYRQLLKAFAPRPVVMRTLDVGGDKPLPYFSFTEDNPFLGWRGIRLTLDHPEVFLVQIRAMLKASVELDNLRIMLPMITHTAEVKDALALIQRAYQELLEEGENIASPQVGIMLEVPSAIYQIRPLARLVDFISVGSNDLTQYILAVDRNNARVANLYDSLHPTVIRALQLAADGAHAERKPISICGEMASDPMAAILLLGMQFQSLSMNATSLLRIKWVLRSFSVKQAKRILNKVLVMENAAEVRQYLGKVLQKAGLGGLIRPGKY